MTYRYHDLGTVNRLLAVFLLPPALLALLGLWHGSGVLARMQDFAPALPVAALPAGYRALLVQDGWLRLAQISLTLAALTFFCTAWLYLAFRNLLALLSDTPRSLRRSLLLFASLVLGIFFALRMFQRLWRQSQPDAAQWQRFTDAEWRAERWLVPLWWLDLIAANACKVLAVYHFSRAADVAGMLQGYHLMLAAYVLYLPLYALTWRLATRVDHLQQLAHLSARAAADRD